MLREISILNVLLCNFLVATASSNDYLNATERNCSYGVPFDPLASNLNGSMVVQPLNETSECSCSTRFCLPMCCPIGTRLAGGKCLPLANRSILTFPIMHDRVSLEPANDEFSVDNFNLFIWDPCIGEEKYRLQPDKDPDDRFKFLTNGSIYMTSSNSVINYMNYCFGAIKKDAYSVVLCFVDEMYDDTAEVLENAVTFALLPIGMMLSVPFLLLTFIVYTVIPELRNMHGSTLRGYVGPLIVAYCILSYIQMTPPERMGDVLCLWFGTYLDIVIFYAFVIFWLITIHTTLRNERSARDKFLSPRRFETSP